MSVWPFAQASKGAEEVDRYHSCVTGALADQTQECVSSTVRCVGVCDNAYVTLALNARQKSRGRELGAWEHDTGTGIDIIKQGRFYRTCR